MLLWKSVFEFERDTVLAVARRKDESVNPAYQFGKGCDLMKYIDYSNMKEFYTIDEVCRLFELDKAELKQHSKKYGVEPQEDQYGNCLCKGPETGGTRCWRT